MAARAPATAEPEFVRVIFPANENLARTDERPLRLRVALEAEIVVAFGEQLGIDRAVRVVTGRAAFPQGFMFEDERFALFPVAGSAGLVHARHGKATRRFQDVRTVRVVTLDAIHPAFEDGMMLRKIELGVGFEVTVQTRGGVFAGIENEFPAAAADFDVFAAGTVAGFARARSSFDIRCKMQAGVGAGGKRAGVVRVTGEAGLVAGEMCAGDLGRNDDLTWHGAAGIEQCEQTAREAKGQQSQAIAVDGAR